MQTQFSLSRSVRFMTATGSLALVATLASPGWPSRSVVSGLQTARADAPAAAPEDEEDEERLVAQQILRDNCLICHSEEMVVSQRLTPPQWKAEVEKMVGFGAPVPSDQVEPLIKYLSNEYPDTKPSAPPAHMAYAQAVGLVRPDAPEVAPLEGDAKQGAKLFATHCATCHGPLAQGFDLGPNLLEIAPLLRQAEFREVTRNGRRRMPGFQTILKPEDESSILLWLRTQRYPATTTK